MYQQRNCAEIFDSLTKFFFENTQEKQTNREKLVFNIIKTTSGKPWLTKETKKLIVEKRRYFNDYKVTQKAESFVSFKKCRNLVNR